MKNIFCPIYIFVLKIEKNYSELAHHHEWVVLNNNKKIFETKKTNFALSLNYYSCYLNIL